MGAKQSKRSVDISGKEAESAGEVAAGAGGEGRVEQLADVDALKPQLNGDAHIHETSEKDKELDSGTPENEKDATTEKEGKEQEDEKDKESSVITNGDTEQKGGENEETTPSPEDSKKPKKEKVKKKWSLRSISFSRKDKPKQEKKQKEDEPKTNGEPEKVPEEVVETSQESEANGVIQEVNIETEAKDEKTPETPVTEPITNGSSTPETPKEEIPTMNEPSSVPKENDRTESPKVEVEPEDLPVNGLTLEEPKNATAEPAKTVTSKDEETIAEKPEPVPATEFPDKNEVCVAKSSLIEPSPPPLPANPPPSSVASFAVTTMAPELTDASLANTSEISSNAARIDTPEMNAEPVIHDMQHTEHKVEIENVEVVGNIEERSIETTPILEEPIETPKSDNSIETSIHEIQIDTCVQENPTESSIQEKMIETSVSFVVVTKIETQASVIAENLIHSEVQDVSINIPPGNIITENNVSIDHGVHDNAAIKNDADSPVCFDQKPPETIVDDLPEETVTFEIDVENKNTNIDEKVEPTERDPLLATNKIDFETCLTEPREVPQVLNALVDCKEENMNKNFTQIVESNGRLEDEKILTNGEAIPVVDEATDSVPVVTPEDSMPPSLSEASELPQTGDDDGSDCLPPPPSELGAAPQELISATDKMAELIPEIPSVPELKTELETTTDVAVAN